MQTGVADNGDSWVAKIENDVVQSWTVTDGGVNEGWSVVINKEYDAARGQWRSIETQNDDGTWSRSYLNDDGGRTELVVSSDHSVTIQNANGVSIKFDGASLSHAIYKVGEDSEIISLDPVYYKAPPIKPGNPVSMAVQGFFMLGVWALSEAGQIIYDHLFGMGTPAGVPDGSRFVFSTADGTDYYASPDGQIWSNSRSAGVSQGIDLGKRQQVDTDAGGFCTWEVVNRGGGRRKRGLFRSVSLTFP